MLGICSTVLQDGPCSPARMSQTRPRPIFASKCRSHARFKFSMVTSLYSNDTNSLGPILENFCVFPVTSADKHWTTISPFSIFISSRLLFAPFLACFALTCSCKLLPICCHFVCYVEFGIKRFMCDYIKYAISTGSSRPFGSPRP